MSAIVQMELRFTHVSREEFYSRVKGLAYKKFRRRMRLHWMDSHRQLGLFECWPGDSMYPCLVETAERIASDEAKLNPHIQDWLEAEKEIGSVCVAAELEVVTAEQLHG